MSVGVDYIPSQNMPEPSGEIGPHGPHGSRLTSPHWTTSMGSHGQAQDGEQH